jgi:hypothetical protein
MAMVRAELCCLQELAYVSITGSKRTAPMANCEALLGLLPLHFVADADARALAYRRGSQTVGRHPPPPGGTAGLLGGGMS